MFSYDDWKWNDVGGKFISLEEAPDFFVKTLGYSSSEYNVIKDAIVKQHSDNTAPDFSHMQIALASRLAYTLDLDGWASNVGTLFASDEEISHMAGWLGDAAITEFNNGKTVMGNDDYCADLDAENVFQQIKNGKSYLIAMHSYYSEFNLRNRAEIFKQYISFDTVRTKVFYLLIDRDIISAMQNSQSPFEAAYLSKLIDDEEYHWNRIKESYPDTYNFLCSLRDSVGHMVEYVKRN